MKQGGLGMKRTRIKVGMVTLSLLVLVALSMVAMQASVLVTLGGLSVNR